MIFESSLGNIISFFTLFIMLSCFVFFTIYKLATKNLSYVRSGYGGEVIAVNSGLFIFPILHHAIPVNLKTLTLKIELVDETAAITQDALKVNLKLDFYLRVIPETDAISQVARSLGDMTLYPEQLTAFFSGQILQASRKIVAETKMTDIHQHQDVFVNKIFNLLSNDFNQQGFDIEHISLRFFDQTDVEFYSETNTLIAEGLTKLTKISDAEKQTRNQITRQSRIENAEKDLEMEALLIELEDKKSRLRSNQKKEFKIFEAANQLSISQDALKKQNEEQRSKILADEELEIFKQKSDITLLVQLAEKLKQQTDTDLIKAEAVKAKVAVKSARKMQISESQVKIKLMKEKIKNEYAAARILDTAVAKKNAANEKAETTKILAKSEALKIEILEKAKHAAEKLIEENIKYHYDNEAEGLKSLIAAFDTLSKSKLPENIYPDLIETLSKFCSGNTQLISKVGLKELISDDNKQKTNTEPETKQADSSINGNSRLQDILNDARTSLEHEAMNTLNEIQT